MARFLNTKRFIYLDSGLELKKYRRRIGFSTRLLGLLFPLFNRITTWWLIKDRREEEKVFLLSPPGPQDALSPLEFENKRKERKEMHLACSVSLPGTVKLFHRNAGLFTNRRTRL